MLPVKTLELNGNENTFPESLGDLSSEFFSLDLSKLEASIMTIPLHKQIDLDEEEIGEEFLEMILKRSSDANAGLREHSVAVEKDLNQKMMDILSIKAPSNVDEKDTGDQKFESEKNGNTYSGTEKQSVNAVKAVTSLALSAPPLEQRQNRKPRGPRTRTNNDIQEETNNCDQDDMDFIEEISKSDSVPVQSNSNSGKTDDANKEVVSVKINSSESKNLEDWLDDFLDD